MKLLEGEEDRDASSDIITLEGRVSEGACIAIGEDARESGVALS